MTRHTFYRQNEDKAKDTIEFKEVYNRCKNPEKCEVKSTIYVFTGGTKPEPYHQGFCFTQITLQVFF